MSNSSAATTAFEPDPCGRAKTTISRASVNPSSLSRIRSNEIGTTESFLAQAGRDGEEEDDNMVRDEEKSAKGDGPTGADEKVGEVEEDYYPEGGLKAWSVVLGVFCLSPHGSCWRFEKSNLRKVSQESRRPGSLLEYGVTRAFILVLTSSGYAGVAYCSSSRSKHTLAIRSLIRCFLHLDAGGMMLAGSFCLLWARFSRAPGLFRKF
ncbi:hypothetical protein P7C70_g3176, partial [Phenoliferia sp. Uapishka_3]